MAAAFKLTDREQSHQRPAKQQPQRMDAVALPSSATTAVIAASSQVWADASVISAALAATRPTVIGKMPAWITPRQGRSLKRSHRPSAMMVMRDDGPNLASVVTSMPAQPATCQPTSVTTIRLGPGAACPRANRAEKSAAVIQPCTSTTWRCISGRMVLPPPNASTDN